VDFEPVRQSVEGAHGVAHRRRGRSELERRGRRRRDVPRRVLAEQAHVAADEHRFDGAPPPRRELAAAPEDRVARGHRVGPRRPHDAARGAARDRRDARVVGVRHEHAARRGDDARLVLRVGLDRPVPVEVVRRDVRQHADRRPQVLAPQPVELERGELEHHEVVRGDRRQRLEERHADVAAHVHAPPRALRALREERRRRALARAARDAGDAAAARAHEHPDLRVDRHAARDRRLDELVAGRHGRVDDEELRVREVRRVVAAEPEPNRQPRERADRRRERRLVAQVGHGDVPPRRGEMARDADAPAEEAEAHDRRPPPRHAARRR
jgi:hypothetical protein